jgi:hypothetical protein
MKSLKAVSFEVLASVLVLVSPWGSQAQDADQLKELKRQLEQMQANFDRVVQEQKRQIEALQKQVEHLEAQRASSPPAGSVAAQPSAETAVAPSTAKPWSLTEPVRVGKGSAYMDIGLVGTFAAGGSTANDIEGGTQLGGHDPNQNGFTLQGLEANFQGAVDPYFRGNANILFSIDSGGESFVELEEAWLETVALPWNLQVRAGQFLTDFGRVNTQHPHSWAFVDTPLVNARFLGPDGLRNPGARVSWLVPTPFYSELFLAIQNSQGETAYSFRNDNDGEPLFGRPVTQGSVESFSDLLFAPRYAVSFDLSDTQTLLAGVSAAFGPNGSGTDTDTQLYGVDLYWKWKPTNAHAGFPFVSWQTEAMLRRYEAGASTFWWCPGWDVPCWNISLPAETVTDWGLYSQFLWGFRKGWVVGLRGDYVARAEQAAYERIRGDDPQRLPRWRLSPNLTWYPSEYSKLRLQYNYDDRADIGVDHSVWLQWELLLGAHAAHKF